MDDHAHQSLDTLALDFVQHFDGPQNLSDPLRALKSLACVDAIERHSKDETVQQRVKLKQATYRAVENFTRSTKAIRQQFTEGVDLNSPEMLHILRQHLLHAGKAITELQAAILDEKSLVESQSRSDLAGRLGKVNTTLKSIEALAAEACGESQAATTAWSTSPDLPSNSPSTKIATR